MKKLLYIVFLFFFSTVSFAQEKIEKASIKMISREQPNKILLRWGVNRPSEWRKTNEFGFILEKFIYSRSGQRLENPELVWRKNIKPEPLEAWEKVIMEDNYAAIIAQALYGESFMVEEGSSGKLADIVNLTQEEDQRFSFSLFAADMSFPAAIKAGWGYLDKDINKDEVYVYRVQSAVPVEVSDIESAAVFADPKGYTPLPSPTNLVAIWEDKNVLLTWDYENFKSIYTSYNIEKSENGVDFELLSPTPLLNINDTPEAPAKRMYYIDSLAYNEKPYFYRVYGISSFGEKGAYSEIVSGQGSADLLFTPEVSKYKISDTENKVTLDWSFPEEGEKTIEKFQLNHAQNDKGPYKVVVDNISPETRKVEYSNLDPSNYFTITAVGKNRNQKKTSYSIFAQPIDSIPPTPPIGLKGSVDSLGVVRMSWTPNIEKDLLGYRIFKGNTEDEEYSQITIDPISECNYVDSVKVKSLNTKVYYRVVAVDVRFNNSEFSEKLILEKPKVIKPSSPVFDDYKIQNGEVTLSWIPAPEEKLKHVLYRKAENSDKWETIFQTNDSIKTFTDKNTKSGQTYVYRIKAVNEVNLESAPSPDMTIKVVNIKPEEIIKEVNTNVDRQKNYIELFWSVSRMDEIVEYTIYKKNESSEPTTWKIIPAKLTRIVDTNINPGHTYTYYIRATLNSGAFSNIKTIEVNY